MLTENQQTFSLIIDFEATGVDVKKDRITEIGAWMVETDTLLPLDVYSGLVYDTDYPELSPEVEGLTHITNAQLKAEGIPLVQHMYKMWDMFSEYFKYLEYIVAYNKSFDEELFKAEAERVALGLTNTGNLFLQVPWLCAMRDVESNYNFKCWKLSHLAVDRGVDVIASELHRAVGDVKLTRKVLAENNISLHDMYKFQQEPWVYIQAQIPAPWKDGGAGRDQAKALGFSWERAQGDDRVFEKTWVKRVKEHQVGTETERAPFRVVRITL